MKKIQLSIGILSWKSTQVLIDTLQTYFDRSFLHHVNDVTILFQEFSETDLEIAQHFNIPYLPYKTNIGIGQAFIELTKNAKTDNVLILEHDWNLIEDLPTTLERLESGIDLLNNGTSAVRYRHRKNPGYPHFSFRHRGEELTYFDKEIGATSPHLLDSLHWLEPDVEFGDKIKKEGEYFTTTSRWANWTNNPTMYKKQFYLDVVQNFAGSGTDLEYNIGKWWVNQNFKVAHGEGLFKHNDWKKYGK